MIKFFKSLICGQQQDKIYYQYKHQCVKTTQNIVPQIHPNIISILKHNKNNKKYHSNIADKEKNISLLYGKNSKLDLFIQANRDNKWKGWYALRVVWILGIKKVAVDVLLGPIPRLQRNSQENLGPIPRLQRDSQENG